MTQIVNGLHFRRFERDLASFVAALHGLVDFDLDNLTLDDLGLFSNSNTYSNSKENQLAFLAQKSNYLIFDKPKNKRQAIDSHLAAQSFASGLPKRLYGSSNNKSRREILTNRLPEGLCKGLSLRHFEREDLGTGEHCEWGLLAEGFGHTHGDGSLTSSWLSTNEDSSTSNLLLPDHLQDHTSGSSSFDLLANKYGY